MVTAELRPGPELRTGLCPSCSALFVISAAADRLECAACKQTSPLAPRITPEQLADALAAIGGRETPSALRYDPLRRPPLEPELADLSADDQGSVKWLYGAFIAARSTASTPSAGYRSSAGSEQASEAGELRTWIALRLALVLEHAGQPLLSRPFLEAVADTAADPGHRYLAFAGLCRLAEVSGDLAAAEAWIAFCPPDPRWLLLGAVSRERRVWLALRRGDWASVEQLTRDRELVPLAWPQRVRLDLARVACDEQLRGRSIAVAALRTTLEAQLITDIEDTLATEPALAPADRAWDEIRAQDKRAALKPVWVLLVFAGITFVAGAFGLTLAPSVVLSCERTRPNEARCTVEKQLLGLELDRRELADVRLAEKERVGKNSFRVALRSSTGVDAPDSAGIPDAERRIETLNQFLADPERPTLTMVWDHEIALLGGATALLSSLMLAGYAGYRRWLIELESRSLR